MHLSVSSLRGGGGVRYRVGILTFSKKNSQNPHPWAKNNNLSKLVETNGLLLFYYIKLKDQIHDVPSKSPPWGYTPQSNSRGLPDPPPLGLDIDRCISKEKVSHHLLV